MTSILPPRTAAEENNSFGAFGNPGSGSVEYTKANRVLIQPKIRKSSLKFGRTLRVGVTCTWVNMGITTGCHALSCRKYKRLSRGETLQTVSSTTQATELILQLHAKTNHLHIIWHCQRQMLNNSVPGSNFRFVFPPLFCCNHGSAEAADSPSDTDSVRTEFK